MALPKIEAIYIFNSGPSPSLVLQHTWSGRPPPPISILPLYLSQPSPQPSLIYASNTSPPTLIHSVVRDGLLFFALTSTDADPLVVLEFLHRLADALASLIGDPLVAHKLEQSHSLLALMLAEICDSGTIATTEPDALKDLVESGSWVHKLLGGPSPSLSSQSMGGKDSNTPAVPWRRSNVRHTSNEMYVDVIETLKVTLAPSGLPLAAWAHGSVVFTAKVSGVPDILLSLGSSAGGPSTLAKTIQLPVFHPCVRLGRWNSRPGDLSFVPPDSKCVLLSYEVDLLGDSYLSNLLNSSTSSKSRFKSPLTLPLSLTMSTPTSSPNTFIITLNISPSSISSVKPTAAPSSRTVGSSTHPALENVIVRVPIPKGVRSLGDLRPTRGEVKWAPGSDALEWRVPPGKDGSDGIARLRCDVTGEGEVDDEQIHDVHEMMRDRWDYDEYEGGSVEKVQEKHSKEPNGEKNFERLMPSSATVSFQVRGWLASGLKVDKLAIDKGLSRGLGQGVQPYKGVKYLTASQDGVEIRC